jgi:signal transduction histidine kinase/ActR/RegA family two-component response regulator
MQQQVVEASAKQAMGDGQALSRVHALAALWTATVALALLVLALTAAQLASQRQDALDSAQEAANRTLDRAAQSLQERLSAIDLPLRQFANLLPAAFRSDQAWSRAQLELELQAFAERLADITHANLVSGDGRVLATSRRFHSWFPAHAAVALRDILQQGPNADIGMAGPVHDSTTGDEVLLVWRWVADAPEPVLVVAELPQARLLSVLTSAALWGRGHIILRNVQGDVLAEVLDRSIQKIPASADARGASAPPDLGAQALRHARTLDTPRLNLSQTLPMDIPLAEWRRDHRRQWVFATLLIALLIVAAGLVHALLSRQWRAAQDAQLARQNLDRALEAMDDGFLLCDAQDRIAAWNARYLGMHPWLKPVLRLGAPFTDLLEMAYRHALAAALTEEERQAWKAQRLARHLSGAVDFEQELSTGEVVRIIERRTPDGGIVSVYRDVTRTERELRRAKQQAEAANEAKSRFLAAMSHEIRTPLNGVLGMNRMLLSSGLNEGQMQQARTIEACGRTLLSLINDILDFSRIEAGRMALESIDFDAVLLAREVMDAMQPRAQELGLELRLTLDGPYWPTLRGDPNRIRQLLFNLVGNALKFTPAGRVEVQALLRPGEPGSCDWLLTVRDTGIGIPPEALPHLFDRFFQADDSTARTVGGSGLGLAICQEIVQLMGGELQVESRVGEGSAFRVRLPLTYGQAAHLAQASEDAPALRPLRLLVAEDNQVNQMVIDGLLRQMGHEPTLVCDGRQAVDHALAGGWDCILMDIQMPGMDGVQAAKLIRALPGAAGRVPIVALTANALLAERQTYLQAGMDDHLAKPVDPARLRETLSRMVWDGMPAYEDTPAG